MEVLPVCWSGAGIREIIRYDPVAYGVQTLHRLAAQLDLIVDLVALGGTTGGRRGAAHSAGVAPSSGLHHVSSQPASRVRGARACRPMTLTARLAAVHAVVEQAPSGGLLPPLDDPWFTPAVAEAALRVLSLQE